MWRSSINGVVFHAVSLLNSHHVLVNDPYIEKYSFHTTICLVKWDPGRKDDGNNIVIKRRGLHCNGPFWKSKLELFLNIISPLNNKSRIDFYSHFLAACKYVCVYTPKLYICMYFIY